MPLVHDPTLDGRANRARRSRVRSSAWLGRSGSRRSHRPPTASGWRRRCTCRSGDGPLAAVMEALPYRKDDITESYRPPTSASSTRVASPCSGSTSAAPVHRRASPTDEYTDVERSDLRTAIEWMAGQPWSNGRVGMFGTSYSGFNSLQMAIDDVPALGAVVATYATDDRYTDDVHYCGGVLRALDLIDYPLYMVAMNALPPVPAVFGEGWRDEWRRRIDATPPWLHGVARAPPTDDATWRRGSIRLGPDDAGYERHVVPDDVDRRLGRRLSQQLVPRGRAVRPQRTAVAAAGRTMGAQDRRTARPGPNVDDDVDVLAFFDEHLHDGGPGSSGAPGQVYVRQPVHPEPDLDFHPGRWVDLDTWPPARAAPRLVRCRSGRCRLAGDRRRCRDVRRGTRAPVDCRGGSRSTSDSDNARSLAYDWPVADDDDAGRHAAVSMRVRVDQTYGHVSVKLCDVSPDGSSTLITRGMLDLRHRGCWPADPAGAVGGGPSARSPVSGSTSPSNWRRRRGRSSPATSCDSPSPAPTGPTAGRRPDRSRSTSTSHRSSSCCRWSTCPHRNTCSSPAQGPHPTRPRGSNGESNTTCSAARRELATRYGGTYDGLHGAVVSDDYRGELGVSTVDPARAWARGSASYVIEWPEATVTTESTLEVTSDAEAFDVTIRLRVRDGDDEIADRRWHRRLPR